MIGDLYDLLTSLQLYNETLIEQEHWKEAERLTKDIDAFDINYVALTLQTDGWLWTGDKKLITHLNKMGFNRIVTTTELFDKIM